MPYAVWNFMTACLVRDPKEVVSFPFDPGPDMDMVKPFAFRKICKAFTSSPVEPWERSLVRLRPVGSDTLGGS